MIDTKELRSAVESAGLNAISREEVLELIDRLEAAEKERDVLRDRLALESQENGALRDSVDRACEERDALYAKISDLTINVEYLGNLKKSYEELIGELQDERDALRVKIETAENDAAHQKALADSALRVAEGWERKCGEMRAALQHETDCVEAAKDKIEALRSKIEAIEKQEPFDADSDVFRGAFEAALKAGNWPATRQGDGYRSPSTQIAWRIAFSTVNRLKLYLAPGAKGEKK